MGCQAAKLWSLETYPASRCGRSHDFPSRSVIHAPSKHGNGLPTKLVHQLLPCSIHFGCFIGPMLVGFYQYFGHMRHLIAEWCCPSITFCDFSDSFWSLGWSPRCLSLTPSALTNLPCDSASCVATHLIQDLLEKIRQPTFLTLAPLNNFLCNIWRKCWKMLTFTINDISERFCLNSQATQQCVIPIGPISQNAPLPENLPSARLK